MSEQSSIKEKETSPRRFDVFLSHNSREKPAVERIAAKLKREGLEPWLDKWCLTPAGDWQDELAGGLRASAACAVFVGPGGMGSWEDLEYKLATDRMAKDRTFRVFLVLLPGLPEPFDTGALPPFLSIRTWVDLRKGFEDARGFQSLINAIKGLPLGPEAPVERRDDVCPYRGLRTFDEEHAEFFFGRDGDVQRLLEKLKAARFLAVLGPSGSGKSSLVRAGLIPALKAGVLPGSDTWEFRVFTPGARPLTALAANLLRLYPRESMSRTLDEMSADERALHLAVSLGLAGREREARVVWVVDQFEEIFTLCTDEAERKQFIANLLYAAFVPGGPCLVLLTMRADFYHKCAAHPELSARVSAGQFLVSPMSAENLRQAIEEPAWHTGLEFEQGLVETILDDVENQPGALPLLEHALLELWGRRRGGMLTLEGYRESGGVEGAIAKRADEIYNSFDAEQQKIARRVMLRLTQPGEGTEDTRRRALLAELVTRADERAAVEGVVQTMADARLLMTGGGEEEVGQAEGEKDAGDQTVDVSHEALIRGWPRLRQWIEEDRAGLRVHRRLTEAAREWQPAKDESLLYRGARLAQAVEWRERNEDALNELEREFLSASAAAQQAIERRRKRVITGLAAGLLIAVALAILAIVQWRRADQQTRIAFAKALAAQSLTQIENDPDLALLLAVEATHIRESVETRSVLLTELEYREHLQTFLYGHTAQVHKVVFSPDGKLLASASGGDGRDNSVRLWDATTGRPVGQPLAGHTGSVRCVSFSPDGKILASSDDNGSIILWDVTTLSSIGQPLTSRSHVYSLAFSPDGKVLASGTYDFDGEISLWDVAGHKRIGEPIKDLAGGVSCLAFSPDGKLLASAINNDLSGYTIIFWDVFTRKTLGKPLKDEKGGVLSLAFNPDGRVLASGGADNTVRLWDVIARKPLANSDSFNSVFEPHTKKVLDVRFAPDGKTLFSVDAENHVLVRQVMFAQGDAGLALRNLPDDTKSLRGYFREMESIAFSPDASRWATGGCRKGEGDSLCIEGEVSIWNVDARLPFSRPFDDDLDDIECVTFSPGGQTLVTAGRRLTDPNDAVEVYLRDVATRQPIGRLFKGASGRVTSLAYSPDGKILATGSCLNLQYALCNWSEIRLWNPDTQQPISEPLKGHDDFVTALVFSPDGKTLASSAGSKIILWDVAARQPIGEIITPGPLSLAFSPDGKVLASGGCGKSEQRCLEGEIRLWDVTTRQLLGQPLAGHTDRITSVAFSPDSKSLASASGNFDKTIRFWDVTTRREIGRPLEGQFGEVREIVFSPGGETLAAASNGSGPRTHSIFLWDLATGRLIGQPLPEHDKDIRDIAFSPNGLTLASGGRDGVVMLLDLSMSTWEANACRIANRNLTRAEWEQYFPNEQYRKTCPNLPEPQG